MSPISWSDLRPLKGSQQHAFEELCCQLAAVEPQPAGSTFFRKAAPDAGVECYWRFPDATEHGWQAKFFMDVPGTSQWQQIDDSIRTALAKHPQLTRYTVCLPRDREDPRLPDQEWFMDKWNAHVSKWQTWATEHGMTVSFEYWGWSELLLHLAKDEHRGRTLFWFNKNLFTTSWFRDRLDVTIANAGPRYSPALRVDLPIAAVFDGFCRTATFTASIAKARGAFGRETALIRVDRDAVKDRIQELVDLRDRIGDLLLHVDGNPPPVIPFPEIYEAADQLRSRAWKLAQVVRTAKPSGDLAPSGPYSDADKLDRVARAADAIADVASADAADAANARLLILRGDQGTGKTHLLCDVADTRVKGDLPSIVLLGEAFVAGEPWTQIITLLGLSCTAEELLGAMDAAAEAADGCALLAIDALNESADRPMWVSHLAGMVTLLKRFPRVRLAVSFRSSYEDAVLPPQLPAEAVFRIQHHGFEGHEYVATKTFFRHFGIALPSVPILNPEFENPLFLKLFCEGLHSAGMTEVPKGLRGVSTVFGFFINATNTKLARENALGFDAKDELVQRAVGRIADLMAERDVRMLPRAEAKEAVDAIHRADRFEQTLFRRLLTEGVLAEDRTWSADGPIDVVRFAYERLADHLITSRLLDRHLDAQDPKAAFAASSPFGQYLRDPSARWNTGLFTALALQLPERFSLELPEALPDLAATDVVRAAVIESVVWRDPACFSDAARAYINTEVLPRRRPREALLDAMLTVAATPGHPYNADRLHKLLCQFTMPDRDRWWSTYLFLSAGAHAAVDRLVDWACTADDSLHLEDESIRLAATALMWFLTTSHRPLRDHATKGLVALLTPRPHVLEEILTTFRSVDDLYVRERLYAVAYGCSMRTTDYAGAARVAQRVYDDIFRDTPPAHLLVRDYARGVVELALARGAVVDGDVARIRPPYGSSWPDMPTAEEVAAFGEQPDDANEDEWARITIHSSIMDGDFGRYIMGTNSGSFEWSPDPLNGPPVMRPREQRDAFLTSLTPRQPRAYARMQQASVEEVFDILQEGTPGRKHRRSGARARAERAFRKTLGRGKIAVYEREVQPYMHSQDAEPRFDLAMAQRWVLKRVFDLGWSVKRFGRFDRHERGDRVDRREAGKAERIGKKYQWIAWHEFVALVADNFRYDDRHGDVDERYEGPWQFFGRDIDPSFLLRKTERQRWRSHSPTWWFPVGFTNWTEPADDDAWRDAVSDLPPVAPLIAVTRPDGTRSLVLEMICQWGQPQPPDADEHEPERRRIFYWIKSYLVRKEHIDEVVAWARARNLHLERFPEVRYPTQAFLGEFAWAPAVSSQTGPYYSRPGWTTGDHRASLPQPVLSTNDNYFWEQSGYDCSIDDTISIELPCKELLEGMQLQWRGKEGAFYDAHGVLTALDPSVQTPGPGALVVARDPLLAYLEQQGLAICWVVFGERQVFLPGHRGMDYNELSGIYVLRGGKIDGELKTFSPAGTNRD